MSKIGKVVTLVGAILLLAAAPAVASHTASLEYPDPTGVDPNNDIVTVRAVITEPDIESLVADIEIAPDGPTSAVRTLRGLCEAATVTWPPGAGLTVCDDPCATAPAGGDAFKTICQTPDRIGRLQGLFFEQGAPGLSLSKMVAGAFAPPANKLKALNYDHSTGVPITQDLLSRYCLRVDRGDPAVDGNVNFTVRYFRPDLAQGPQVQTFTVNTTGRTDTELHRAIVDGFTNLGLGLELGVMDEPGTKCVFAHTFNGPLVSIWNLFGSGVREVKIDALPGQRVVAETNADPSEGAIPTLSEWGLILLVALLSVSALWMLRRRKQVGSAA